MTEEKSESWICMFMDAMPFNLEFEVNNLQIIEMLPRHCGFQVIMTEAAEKMLGISSPLDYDTLNVKIDELLQRLRNGEEVECDETFPAAVLGVLWSWQLVLKYNWTWCAVSQNWWETIAVCDPTRRCAILPVQYFRGLVEEFGEIGITYASLIKQWPKDLLANIEQGRLPIAATESLACVY